VAAPLTGRTALVTGGTRGLGLEIARAYERAGARVLVTGRDQAALDASGFEAVRADVSDRAACEAAVARAAPDVLVNNAAVTGPIGPLEDNDWDAWLRTVEINLLGTVLMCRAAVPGMRQRGYGKIVNLSGGGATGPRPNFSAYATAKAAVVRFTETLAAELAGTGVDVNAIAPGALNTRMRDDVLAAGPQRAGAEYAQALERAETSFEPATRLAVFLASSASDGISGRLLAALWDDWESLDGASLDADAYTLRRVVP
jgi:NAD(P)-dependent dehydrogenase (short-subunit alcohol dehydrogenase family)